jgi:hypothetical protein
MRHEAKQETGHHMRDPRFLKITNPSLGRLGSSALAAILLILGSASAPAQDDPIRDCRLAMRARQAWQQDPALANVIHLGVTVRAGTATIWGAVPSAELARRAETLVRDIQGIFEVRNELHVEVPNDPIVEFLRTPNPRSAQKIEPQWIQANRQPAQLMSSAPAPTNGVALLPPITLQGLQPTGNATSADLAAAIQLLQQPEPRFWSIHAEVQGGVVRLRGSSGHREDLFELAQRISRLAGVERVVVDR